MHVIKRSQWGARPAGSLSPNPLGKSSTLYVHWSTGRFNDVVNRKDAKAAVREIQAFHMDSDQLAPGGGADIAYSYVVVQARGKLKRALILEGRLFRNVPASQLGANTGNGSVCVLMGQGEPLLKGTVAALKQVYSHFPGTKLGGHRDVVSTECPGRDLYAALPRIRQAPKRKVMLP